MKGDAPQGVKKRIRGPQDRFVIVEVISVRDTVDTAVKRQRLQRGPPFAEFTCHPRMIQADVTFIRTEIFQVLRPDDMTAATPLGIAPVLEVQTLLSLAVEVSGTEVPSVRVPVLRDVFCQPVADEVVGILPDRIPLWPAFVASHCVPRCTGDDRGLTARYSLNVVPP